MNGAAAVSSGRTWEEASSPEAIRAARTYEDSWRRSGRARPDLADYLGGLSELGNSSGVKLALFRADMSLRWEVGDKVGAQWYLDRFQDLSDDTLVALVYEEFCLREEEGEKPLPADYQARYPRIAKGLARVFEIHGLVGSGTMSVSSLSTGGGDSAGVIPFPEVGQTIAGFHLVEDLGKGAFARVFLAHERQLADRPVALKVTRKGSREPQTLARLQHTHIVPVYSHRVDPATGLNLLCMPYFGRITLAQILDDTKTMVSQHGGDLAASLDRLAPSEGIDSSRSEGRLALASRTHPRAIAWWGARLAEALQHAHERGVLHRDIKPSNVLVTADGMPMLLDFNLAREPLVDGQEQGTAGTLGGTVDYMAPEHLEALADGCSHQVDGRSDLFGLGVVLYQAVMGHRPFPQIRKRSSMSESLLSAADERRTSPPSLRAECPKIPPALETVIRRCLEPDPADRYQSGADLAADLQAVADDRPLLVAREPILNRFASWARHRRRRLVTLASVAAALLLLLAAMTAVILQRRMDLLERCASVRVLIDRGEEACEQSNFAQAEALFKSADELSQATDWRSSIATGEGEKAGGVRTLLKTLLFDHDRGDSLADLQLKAHLKETSSRERAERCALADQFHHQAEELRFSLIGFGNSIASASERLQKGLKEFFILDPAPVADWTRRDFVRDQLDPARMARLRHEVNELMFLWGSEIDISLSKSKKPDVEHVKKALDLCDRALCFVERPAPWRALRARLERRAAGGSDASVEPAGLHRTKTIGPKVKLDEFAPSDTREETSALAAFQWGILYFNEPNLDAALPWLERAVELEAKNYWYQYYLAFAYHMRGRTSKALDHYNLAADLNRQSPWVLFSRARLYHRSVGNWRRAIDDLNTALVEFSKRPKEDQSERSEVRQVELELGLVHQSLGDDGNARKYFESVIRKNPSDSFGKAARLNLANGQADLGRIDEPLEEYGKLLALNPMDQAARRSRALVLLRAGKANGAEADLTFLIDLEERCQERDQVLAARALARMMQGPERVEGAVEDSIAAWKLVPSRANERLRQRALLAAGRVGDLQIDRPDEIAQLPLGGRRTQVDLLNAVKGLEQRKRRRTVNAYPASLTQAVLLAALKNPGEAETAATIALQISPESPHALLIRARVRFFAGDLKGAMADVDHGLLMWPGEPGLQEMKAALLTTLGRPEEAIQRLRLINSEGINQPSIDCWSARAQMALGDTSAALVSWSHAIGRDPQLAEAYLGRGECRIVRGEWDEAIIDLANAAAWANSDLRLEGRIFLGFTRCLAHKPNIGRRWLSMGWRLLSHAWEQKEEGFLF